MTEKVGLQAVLETKDFQDGLKIYLNGLKESTKASEDAAKAISREGAVWDDNVKRWRNAAGKFVSGAAPVIDATAGMQTQIGGLTGMLITLLGGLSPVTTEVEGAAVASTSFASVLGSLVSPQLLAVGAAAGIAVAAIREVVEVLKDAAVAAKDLVVESVKIASRWEELTMVAQLMGQRFGMSSEGVDDLIESMKEAGIRADIAAEAISQFVRMDMDPMMALDLGKAAQDFAILAKGGADSSETLERLMEGIYRLSPLMLRNAGATVHLNGAYEAMAKELGKTQESLTTVEKQQAAFNEVMAQGAKISGAYEIAMNTAGKQMRSLVGREIPTLKAALGAPFQDAFLNVAESLREIVKAITEAISYGGAFFPVLANLGAIASIVTDSFRWAAQAIKDWIAGFTAAADIPKEIANAFLGGAEDAGVASSEMMLAVSQGIDEGAEDAVDATEKMVLAVTDTIMTAVEEAVMWGANLVTGFADGIIQAASTVLVWAMEYIGSILTGWLKGASPPKVAPEILEWGKAAMTEFLKGFTEADFSALKDIQNPLKTALDLMVSAGKVTAKEAARTFLDISQAMADALSSGTADQSLFDRIAADAGEFGAEIARLAEQEFMLADATEEVAEAQERVNKALEKEKGAEQAVRSLTDEYNRMLRAGASDEVLKAKLAEINAAEEQAILARDQRKAAEGELDEKQATLDILKEQVSLQKQLVDQLLALARAAILPQKAPAAGGGVGGEEPPPPVGGGFEIDPDTIKNKIREIVEIAKEEMLRRWNELWADVKKLAAERFGEALASLSDAWDTFTKTVSDWYDQNMKPVFEDIKLWAETNLPAAWEAFTTAGETAWDWYQGYMVPILKDLWQILVDIKDIILIWVTPQIDAMKEAWKRFRDYSVEYGIPAVIEGWTNLNLAKEATDAWKKALGFLQNGLSWVNTKLKIFHDFLVKIKDLLLNMPSWKDATQKSPVPLAEGLKAVNAQLSIFRSQLLSAKGVISSLNGMSVSTIINPAMASQSVISPVSNRVLNVNQQNNIQSPMDMATFRAMFNQVIREQFSGA